PGDVDFYKFGLSSAQTFTASLDLGSTVNPGSTITITLYKDNGGGSLTQIQQATSATQFDLLQRSLTAGNYQVKISTTAFFYEYTVGFSTGDNDDSIPEANVTANNQLLVGQARDFTLSSASDVDLFQINLDRTGDKAFAIDIDSRNGSSFDTFLRIFDDKG